MIQSKPHSSKAGYQNMVEDSCRSLTKDSTICAHLCRLVMIFKTSSFLSGHKHNIVDVHVWISECGTCLVMLKHPSYTSSVFLHRQPKKQDVNDWRDACSPSQSWAPGIGTRGKEQLFSRQFSFFPAFLPFFPPLGNGLIITPRPEWATGRVTVGATRSVWGAWW